MKGQITMAPHLGRALRAEKRIAELEHDIDQYRKIDKDMLKRIAALKATIKRIEKHKDSKILECQCLQEVVDKNLISIKAIRELPRYAIETTFGGGWKAVPAEGYESTTFVDTDELEALLPGQTE